MVVIGFPVGFEDVHSEENRLHVDARARALLRVTDGLEGLHR